MTDRSLCYDIAVPVPFAQTLTYAAPSDGQVPQCGQRVRVPVQKRYYVGVVVAVRAACTDVEGLRPIASLLDPVPWFDKDYQHWMAWISDFYHHPLGEVWHTALPPHMRGTKAIPAEMGTHYRRTAKGEEALESGRPSSAQSDLLSAMIPGVAHDRDWLLWSAGVTVRTLQAVLKQGWIERVLLQPKPLPLPAWTGEQAAAIEAIQATHAFGVHVLQGVTGSGKTAVYIALANQVIQQGGQVLVLVPEIALTPQTVSRFQASSVGQVVWLHSGLRDSVRANHANAVMAGEADLLIGTRSSVFMVMPRLALIIIDESHDASYQQDTGCRYHARDIAIKRAKLSDVPVVLGSATPALETMHHIRTGRYHVHVLKQRPGNAPMPTAQVVDMRSGRLDHGLLPSSWLRVEQAVSQGQQVMLFINRRGYAPVVMCHACGWLADCHACDAHLTWHEDKQMLVCHHCLATKPRPTQCLDCGEDAVISVGVGVEQVVAGVRQHLADVPVYQVDRDQGSTDVIMRRLRADLSQGLPAVVVGTQMLVKGHDFEHLSLVVVVDADALLYAPDFRSEEKTAQTLLQVSGRAGRGSYRGHVLWQTRRPQHPLWSWLVAGDYQACAEHVLSERQAAALPPFSTLVWLLSESRDPHASITFLNDVRALLLRCEEQGVRVLGPAPAWMQRKAHWHRFELMLLGPRAAVQAVLRRCVPVVRQYAKSYREVRWFLQRG